MPVSALPQALIDLADTLERGGAGAGIPGTLQRVERERTAFATRHPGAEMEQLSTVLRAWTDVWGRLGGDPAFRGAMAREARGWAKRCEALHG